MKLFRIILCFTLIARINGQFSDYFWHITDIHYIPDYVDDPCGEGDDPQEDGAYLHYHQRYPRGPYGGLGCQSPWDLVDLSLQGMFSNGRLPTFIFWTGDTNPKTSDVRDLSVDELLSNIRNVTDRIKHYFHDVPVYVTLGYHDYSPRGQLSGETNALYEGAAQIWGEWINTDDAQKTFKKGGYYTVPMQLGGDTPVRAVMLNTNLYGVDNKATEGEKDPGGQYQWLENTLTQARQAGEKVHILMHTPPGTLELTYDVIYLRPEHNKRLSDVFIEYSDVIISTYAGHSHYDSYRLFYNEGTPVTSLLIAPSMTSWTPGGERPTNPAIRKITYDRYQHHLTNVEQYWLDISRANTEGPERGFERLYTFQAAYGLQNATVASLQILLEDFKKFASENFHRYQDFNAVRLDPLHPLNPPCSCQCKDLHLCAIEYVDYDEHAGCVNAGYCDSSGSSWLHKYSSYVLIVVFVSGWILY